MSALVRQAPMIHVVQLVRPLWLCSGCCEVTGTSDRLSACSWSFDSASFREILASPERGGGVVGGEPPNYGVIFWLPKALQAVLLIWPFGRQRRHAQLLLSLGLLFSCF